MSSESTDPNTPGHALWHTPELLTLVLNELNPHIDLDDDKPMWPIKISNILAASNYSLDVGAGTIFSDGSTLSWSVSQKGIMGLFDYLRGQGCPESRIQLYCSKVQELDLHRNQDRIRDTTAIDDLPISLAQIFGIYPSVRRIQMPVNGTRIDVYRYPPANRVTELGTDYQVEHHTVCEGCVPAYMERLSALPINPCGAPVPVTALEVNANPRTGAWNHTQCLGLPRSAPSYASLRKLECGDGIRMSWSQLKSLLDSASLLSEIDVGIYGNGNIARLLGGRTINGPRLAEDVVGGDEGGPETSDIFGGKTYGSIQSATLNIIDGEAERVLACMRPFPDVRLLSITWSSWWSPTVVGQIIDGVEEEPPRQHTAAHGRKLLQLGDVRLSGNKFTHNFAMDLLEYAPNVKDISIEANTLEEGRESEALKDIADICCATVQWASLQYGKTAFPVLPCVDDFVRRLPNLHFLMLSAVFPNRTSHDLLRAWGPFDHKPRWPSMDTIYFTFYPKDRLGGEPGETEKQADHSVVAEILFRCLPYKTSAGVHDEYRWSEQAQERVLNCEVDEQGKRWTQNVSEGVEKLRREFPEKIPTVERKEVQPGWRQISA